jgi:hypothetical protein
VKRLVLLVAIVAVSPAQARSSLGLDSWFWLALAFIAAVIVCIVTIGGPIALINKLTGRPATDEDGGKIFALSFFVGPVIAGLLMAFVDKEHFGESLLIGYVAAIFLLSHWFKRLPPK